MTTTVWIFQVLNWRNLAREDLPKGNLKKEVECLQIVIQNSAIMIY